MRTFITYLTLLGGSLVDGEVKYGNGFMLQDLESLTQIQS